MIELSCPVTLDGNRHGLVVGRTFDLKRQGIVYDVRLPAGNVILYLDAEHLTVAGSCQNNVIGRDIPHNPGRAHLFEAGEERQADERSGKGPPEEAPIRDSQMKYATRIASILLAASIAFGLHQASAAPTEGSARSETPAAFIERLGDRVVEIFAPGADYQQRLEAIKDIVRENVDFDRIGRFVAGAHLREMTPAQQGRYTTRYREYVVDATARRFSSSSYRFVAFRITAIRPMPGGDTLVETKIEQGHYTNRVNEPLPDPPPLHINWRVENAGEHYKVFDVVIEDLSLALTQREEFASVIEKSRVDGLLGLLDAKVARLHEQDGSN